MHGATSTTKKGGRWEKKVGGGVAVNAAQQHKGTSEELSHTAEMKGFGRAEPLLQWDIKRDNKRNKTRHV